MLTFPELVERLKRVDEVDLLELLNISSEELAERFQDLIEEKFDQLVAEFDDDDETEYQG